MPLETKPWDVVDHLDSEEAIAAYLEAVLEDGDPALIAAALGDVARARGMTNVARDAGLSREHLYRALTTGGNPAFGTFLKVLKALGLRLHIGPAAPPVDPISEGSLEAGDLPRRQPARAVSGPRE